MTDPTRLLDDLATDSAARSALLAGRADRGPAHRREQLWAALAPQLPLDPSSLGQPAAPPLDPSAGALGQAAAPSSAATSTVISVADTPISVDSSVAPLHLASAALVEGVFPPLAPSDPLRPQAPATRLTLNAAARRATW